MRYLAVIAALLLCAVSLDSQIAPGSLHRLISSSLAGGVPGPESISSIRYYWNNEDLTNNAVVTNWIDRIQGVVAFQSDVAKMPTNYSAGVYFNGTSFFLTNNPTFVGSLSATGSVWFLIKPYTGTASLPAVLGATDARGVYARDTSVLQMYGNAGNTAIRTFVTGEYLDVTACSSNSSLTYFYTNGVFAKSATVGLGWTHGHFGTDGLRSGYYKGYLAEVAWYSNVLSSAQAALLHTYATNKYGYTP